CQCDETNFTSEHEKRTILASGEDFKTSGRLVATLPVSRYTPSRLMESERMMSTPDIVTLHSDLVSGGRRHLDIFAHIVQTSSQTTGSTDASPVVDCSLFNTCDGCITGDPALNLTRCVWQSCNDGNDTRCMSDTEDSGGCSVYNETGMCQTDAGSGDGDTGGKDDTGPDSNPQFSQASFDLSSFIGGIILVLVLQAGGFFAMRFLKTKDSSYETIDQPQ
ncbi:hypothetical protein DNTS_032512, partial [Danionella cerebrum]